jgi:hypothetical protein
MAMQGMMVPRVHPPGPDGLVVGGRDGGGSREGRMGHGRDGGGRVAVDLASVLAEAGNGEKLADSGSMPMDEEMGKNVAMRKRR